MRILILFSGEYGKRPLQTIRQHGPAVLEVATWQAPALLPPVIDYPEDYLPESMPPAELILSFAENKGVVEPDLKILIDSQTRCIIETAVVRDAVCGCARHVAEQLVGISVDGAEAKAGLFHHHYPCLASMQKEPDFHGDTLMHA